MTVSSHKILSEIIIISTAIQLKTKFLDLLYLK